MTISHKFSFAISLLALGLSLFAAWPRLVKTGEEGLREEEIREAVQKELDSREARLVREWRPKFLEIYNSMLGGFDSATFHPTSYRELLKPMIKIVTEIGGK